MNERLPYDDVMFDAVVCIDGIEHIERTFDLVVKQMFLVPVLFGETLIVKAVRV